MKTAIKLFGVIALAAVIGFTFIACDDGSGGGGEPDLPGTIVISGPVGKTTFTVGDTLTATYTTTGTETVSYQWKRNVSNVGTNTTTYIPDQAGSYTVTVSANGFKSKTSTAITVNEGKTLASITAEYEPATTILPDTTLDTLKEGLTVKAHYSDSTSKTLNDEDYALSGELAVGESVITATYTEGGVTKSADFTVTVNAPHVHNYGAWYIYTPATCTEAGVEREDCTADPPHFNERVIAALDHDWNDTYTTIDAATVTDNGTEAITCKHDASHTKDSRIQYATGTAGLAFEAIGSPVTAYRVRKGTVTGGAVHIPAYYRPDADSPYLLVTQIGSDTDSQTNNAFGGTGASNANTTVTSITFAEETLLTAIGAYAFSYCTGLTSITVPASVTSIGMNAFNNCSSLAGITLAGVMTIRQWTFTNCTSLTSVTIPASVLAIQSAAFDNCSSLASVTFEGSILESNFTNSSPSTFPGDLRFKYVNNGGRGTYTTTRTSGDNTTAVWTKQPSE